MLYSFNNLLGNYRVSLSEVLCEVVVFLRYFIYILFIKVFIRYYTMKKLEVNKVFSLFDYSNEEIPQYMEDVKSNPYVRIGEVVHGVVNYFLIDQIYINKKVPGYVDKRESLREDFFNKIYRFLEGIDVTECGNRFMVADSYDSERSVKVLKVLLKHFEQVEHYEKCANILRFINILS